MAGLFNFYTIGGKPILVHVLEVNGNQCGHGLVSALDYGRELANRF